VCVLCEKSSPREGFRVLGWKFILHKIGKRKIRLRVCFTPLLLPAAGTSILQRI
jgi:hypothetical protein